MARRSHAVGAGEDDQESEVRALVIGGCGYLGRRLVEMLIARGTYASITVMDKAAATASPQLVSTTTTSPDGTSVTRMSPERCNKQTLLGESLSSGLIPAAKCSWYPTVHVMNKAENPTSVCYVQGDVRRLADIINAITTTTNCDDHDDLTMVNSPRSGNGASRVFHLASPHPHGIEDEVYHSVNVLGTKNILEACRICGVKELIYCSSCSVVFGNKPLKNVNESIKYAAPGHDSYNTSKAVAEKGVLEADGTPLESRRGEGKVLRTASVRPHQIFGPGDPMCVGGMISIMKKGKANFIIGDGSTLVDPTYVDNVCWGHMLVAERLAAEPKLGGLAYNITNDEPVKFWSFYSSLCGSLGYGRPSYHIPAFIASAAANVAVSLGLNVELTPRRVNLVTLQHTYSCNRAKTMLGYRPLVSLRDGMHMVVKHAIRTDSEILHKVNDAKARQKSFKKHGGLENKAVRTDIRVIGLLWTLFYISMFVFFGTAGQALRLAVVQICSMLSGVDTSPGSPIWDYEASYFQILVPVLYVVHTHSMITWIILSFWSGMAALGLYALTTRSTVLDSCSSIPLIGDLIDSGGVLTQTVIKHARQNFDCFRLSALGLPIVFFTGRDGYEFFFKASDEEVSLKEVYKITKGLFGEKVVYDVDLDTRQQQFHFLAQGLSENRLMTYSALILMECEQFFSSWGDSGECEDVENILSQLITFTACRCLLGKEVRERFYKECKDLLLTIDKGVTPLGMICPFFPIPRHLARDRARMKLKNIFSTIINERRVSGRAKSLSEDEHDIMDILMNAKMNNGTSLTDSQICGLLTVLIFGGQHTSSVTSTWTLINILSRATPDMVELLLNEQEDLQKSGGITFTGISKNSNVLGACLIESLRLSNPLALVLRYCTKSRYFKGHEFGEGSILAVCPNEATTNPDIFDNPNDFIPRRWIESDWDEWRQMYKFVGFGAGRHTCMGRRFAHIQIKTIISYMLQTFSMTPLTVELPKRNDKEMVIGPDRPYKIRYQRINGDVQNARSNWKHVCEKKSPSMTKSPNNIEEIAQ
eukprot:GHVS01105941.1.p1 GENE.GHVS01105941.1~~GHVS01105941.1.p1  ORF type:complete len:1044 (-),score=83.15 GHVS01105941.1:1169-4300(-)